MNLSIPDFRSQPNRSDRPRLLMLTHRLPYPPDKGERIRAYHMLKTLGESHEVSLVSLVDQPPSLQDWCRLDALTGRLALWPQSGLMPMARAAGSVMRGRSITEGYFVNHHLREELTRWHNDQPFDAALAVCSSMAAYLIDLDIPVKVLDLIDVDSAKWADYSRISCKAAASVYQMEAERLACYERELAGQFHHVIVTTEPEARLYRQIAPAADVTVVPNGVDLNYFQPAPPVDRPIAVFTGALNYRPNIDGLCWLVEHVWPHVRSRVQGAVLRIVGRDPVRPVMKLNRVEGVEVVGPVDDVRPHLVGAAVAVAPLRIARGVQNKVLEAMACGRAVLTMPAVGAAIGARPGSDLLVAADATQWTDRLVRLFADATARDKIGRQARRFVERTHRWDHALAPLLAMLQTPATGPTVEPDDEDQAISQAA